MKEQDFLDKMETIVDSLNNRMITKEASISALVQLFAEASIPYANMQNSLGQLLYKVWNMRNRQKQFFAGDKTMISESKKFEKLTDDHIANLMKMPIYRLEELAKKYEQVKLF